MKKILPFLVAFLISFSSLAQTSKAYPKEGLTSFMEEFIKKFDYKKPDDFPKSISEIKFKVKFNVESDGSFSEIEVVDDDFNFQNDVVRVFNEMPFWQAAVFEGKPVRASFTLPITIRLHSKSSEENFFKTEEEITNYKKILKTNKIELENFEFNCNCVLTKTSSGKIYEIEEFTFVTPDNYAFYSIGIGSAVSKDISYYIDFIKEKPEMYNGTYKEIQYKNRKAIETELNISDNSYTYYYRTIFFIEGDYLIGLNVISFNKQVMNLTYEDLLENFKLKK
ncbi:hypothetical protein NU10_10115 [Flavobacterium dauae]|uniref:hypothetical protein n=1 Tax=Flavobacterium dauae TaxID=1563479 RepID=UPI00101B22C7|nr:hypothetical protein [Flavobacterium dauae]WLD23063.1 hypothetical protein NU10_10115 [Flavobacterium dauae]